MKKISTNLDGPNNSTSSLEAMLVEITFALKYCFAPGEVALGRR